MADKTPININGDFHKPLADTDVISGKALKISADDGNTLKLGTDDGLLTPALNAGDVPIVTGEGLQGDGTTAKPAAIKLKEGGGLSVDDEGVAVAFDAADAPEATEDTELPTSIYGARTALLGDPSGWFEINGKKVPYWD